MAHTDVTIQPFFKNVDDDYSDLADNPGEGYSGYTSPTVSSQFTQLIADIRRVAEEIQSAQQVLSQEDVLRRIQILTQSSDVVDDPEFNQALETVCNLSADLENVIRSVNANDDRILILLKDVSPVVTDQVFEQFEDALITFLDSSKAFEEGLKERINFLENGQRGKFSQFMNDVRPKRNARESELTQRLEEIAIHIEAENSLSRGYGTKLSDKQMEELAEATDEHAVVGPYYLPDPLVSSTTYPVMPTPETIVSTMEYYEFSDPSNPRGYFDYMPSAEARRFTGTRPNTKSGGIKQFFVNSWLSMKDSFISRFSDSISAFGSQSGTRIGPIPKEDVLARAQVDVESKDALANASESEPDKGFEIASQEGVGGSVLEPDDPLTNSDIRNSRQPNSPSSDPNMARRRNSAEIQSDSPSVFGSGQTTTTSTVDLSRTLAR